MECSLSRKFQVRVTTRPSEFRGKCVAAYLQHCFLCHLHEQREKEESQTLHAVVKLSTSCCVPNIKRPHSKFEVKYFARANVSRRHCLCCREPPFHLIFKFGNSALIFSSQRSYANQQFANSEIFEPSRIK